MRPLRRFLFNYKLQRLYDNAILSSALKALIISRGGRAHINPKAKFKLIIKLVTYIP